jgi:hypothetical protein
MVIIDLTELGLWLLAVGIAIYAAVLLRIAIIYREMLHPTRDDTTSDGLFDN